VVKPEGHSALDEAAIQFRFTMENVCFSFPLVLVLKLSSTEVSQYLQFMEVTSYFLSFKYSSLIFYVHELCLICVQTYGVYCKNCLRLLQLDDNDHGMDHLILKLCDRPLDLSICFHLFNYRHFPLQIEIV